MWAAQVEKIFKLADGTSVRDSQDMKEAARQARDVAKAELMHHEENLVTSTRETDRLLNEYKWAAFNCTSPFKVTWNAILKQKKKQMNRIELIPLEMESNATE